MEKKADPIENRKVIRNVIITETLLFGLPILTFFYWIAINPQAIYAFFGGLILAVILFVFGHLLAALTYFILKRKRECRITLYSFLYGSLAVGFLLLFIFS